MTGFIQLLCHAWGDYIFQTDRMANMKTRSWRWATFHALAYSLAFIIAARIGLLHLTLAAWLVIVLTHVVIDRYRLARYVVAFKNSLTDWNASPAFFRSGTGYVGTPDWMAVWLLILADNILHLTINFAALRWLG